LNIHLVGQQYRQICLTSYPDVNDIRICCKSIWPILVSKELSGRHQTYLVIRFLLKFWGSLLDWTALNTYTIKVEMLGFYLFSTLYQSFQSKRL
jgi:hypothetical protein